MATNIPSDQNGDTNGDQCTPQVSHGSAPIAPPVTPSQGRPRTERPTEPEHIYHAFQLKDTDEATIGNNELIFTLKEDGQLGIFYDRDSSTRSPTHIEMYTTATRDACTRTLFAAIDRLMTLNQIIQPQNVAAAATEIATQLSNGIMVMIYLKLRMTNYLDSQVMERFYKKPKVPVPFEVPRPYALAISQLGQIKASGLPTEPYFSPVISAPAAGNFCLPQGISWSPISYCRAMEYAKRIGMQFATVDLSVKMGSTWWLYRPQLDNGVFTLNCPLPEENFTKATAALASLFCVDGAGGFDNPIFNLAPLGLDNYGTMLRSPPDRVDLSTFFAIDDAAEIVWKIT